MDIDGDHGEQLTTVDDEQIFPESQTETIEEPVFVHCPLTASCSSLFIMQFKMRHNLTDEALSDLLKMLRLHIPTSNHFSPSVYKFKTQFSDLKHLTTFAVLVFRN